MLYLWLLCGLGCRSEAKDEIQEDRDKDGFTVEQGDCDDTQPLSHPDAVEVCDGLDNDCNGEIDEGVGDLWYVDTDGDGFGIDEQTILSCEIPPNHAFRGGDCDDQDPYVSPLGIEQCDSIDNDCNGIIDDTDDGTVLLFADTDGDGYGDIENYTLVCQDAVDGYVANAHDCDDSQGAIYPGAMETCNDALDQDCDGFDNGPQCSLSLAAADAIFRGDGSLPSGGQIGPVGDVNGDGLIDIGVGGTNVQNRIQPEGHVQIFFAPISGELRSEDADIILQSAVEDISGIQVIGGNTDLHPGQNGDLNGDGFDDIVLGVHGNNAVGEFAGAVYVVYGPLTDDVDLPTQADAIWYAETAGDYAGYSLDMLGDINGDGLADFVVGAYRHGENLSRSGASYLIFGPAQGDSLADADVRLYGNHLDNFGYEVASIGDVNGDGNMDFAINAYRHEGIDDEYNAGLTYVFHGPVTSDLSLTAADVLYYGVTDYGQSGSTLSSAGDVDGDGLGDLLIGSQFEAYGGLLSAGVVRVFTDNPQGSITLDQANATIYAENQDENFARSAATLGDINNDGFADIAVGSKRADGLVSNGGAVYLFAGPLQGSFGASLSQAALFGAEQEGWAGINIANAGDVNEGGSLDLLVGGKATDDEGNSIGMGYLIHTENLLASP